MLTSMSTTPCGCTGRWPRCFSSQLLEGSVSLAHNRGPGVCVCVVAWCWEVQPHCVWTYQRRSITNQSRRLNSCGVGQGSVGLRKKSSNSGAGIANVVIRPVWHNKDVSHTLVWLHANKVLLNSRLPCLHLRDFEWHRWLWPGRLCKDDKAPLVAL